MILKQFFKTLSYVFHPLFIPLIGIYFLFTIQTRPLTFNVLDSLCLYTDGFKYFIYVLIAILTIVAPLLSLLIMYANKIIRSLNMEKREERIYPYILVTFYYLLAYIFIRTKIQIELQHPALVGFIFGILVLLITTLIVNFYVKISLHAAAIFGLCGMLIGYSQTQLPVVPGSGATNLFMILYLLILAGIVAAGRIYLKAHSLAEIILGSMVGFLIVYVTVKFGIFI